MNETPIPIRSLYNTSNIGFYDAIYYPQSMPSINFIVNVGSVSGVIGFDSQSNEVVHTFYAIFEDIGKPKRGEEISINGVFYVIDNVTHEHGWKISMVVRIK